MWGKDSGAGHHARPLQRTYVKQGTIDLPARSAIGADCRIRLGGAWKRGQTELQFAVVRYGCRHVVAGHCGTGRLDTGHKGRSGSHVRVGVHSLMEPAGQSGGNRSRFGSARELTRGEGDSARHEGYHQDFSTQTEPSHPSNDSIILLWKLRASGCPRTPGRRAASALQGQSSQPPPEGPSISLTRGRASIAHSGVSVTCSRPVISMTSPSSTLKVTLDSRSGPGVAAHGLIDALARDDEGAVLPGTRGGDIPPWPQVLSDRPGSCIEGRGTMGRHERRRNRSEDDLRKAGDLNLIAV